MSFDASGDGRVSAVDALWVINYLAQQDSNFADQRFWQGQQDMDWASLDINHDGVVSAVDALHVIDELARQQFATGEAEDSSLRGMGDADTTGVLVDLAHADLFFEEPLRENRWMSVAGDEPMERHLQIEQSSLVHRAATASRDRRRNRGFVGSNPRGGIASQLFCVRRHPCEFDGF